MRAEDEPFVGVERAVAVAADVVRFRILIAEDVGKLEAVRLHLEPVGFQLANQELRRVLVGMVTLPRPAVKVARRPVVGVGRQRVVGYLANRVENRASIDDPGRKATALFRRIRGRLRPHDRDA